MEIIWSCPKCSFHNRVYANHCQLCETPNPQFDITKGVNRSLHPEEPPILKNSQNSLKNSPNSLKNSQNSYNSLKNSQNNQNSPKNIQNSPKNFHTPILKEEEDFDDKVFQISDLEFVCDIEGCGTAFASIDLFEEHMQLHRMSSQSTGGNTQLRGQHDEEGYFGQYERHLMRLFERDKISPKKLAYLVNHLSKNSTKPDKETRTKDLPNLVKSTIKSKFPDPEIFICKEVHHFFTSMGDAGWGCGYRNLQMMTSYLLQNSFFTKQLFGGLGFVPSVTEIQGWIEKCWNAGFDKEGSKIFNGKLSKTKGMIGTNDVAALMRFFGIRMNIVDFISTRLDAAVVEAQKQQYPFPKQIIYYEPNTQLFEWVYRYFSQGHSQHTTKNVLSPRTTFLPPLYLQHPGHSRTIIGIEKNKKNGETFLIVFDPAYNGNEIKSYLKKGDIPQNLLIPVSSFTHESYQIGYIESKLLTPEEKEASKVMDIIK